jgi:hypothetical protein
VKRRTAGRDGKSYPATRPKPSRPTRQERRFEQIAHLYASIRAEQYEMSVELRGCRVCARRKNGRRFTFEIMDVCYEADGRAVAVGVDHRCDVEAIVYVEALPKPREAAPAA